jgi:Tfp pilus assembly protein PilV
VQSVKLYSNGQTVAATYDPATGTLTPTNPLPEGPHALTYAYVSPTGNESNQSAPLNLTVDATAPATPAAPAGYNDNAGAVQNPNSTAPTTDDSTPGINVGTLPAGITPSLYVNGTKVPATYDPVAGTLTPTSALPEGAQSLTYTLTDPAGNESQPSGALVLTIDTTAPTAPAAPTSYNDNVGSLQNATSTAAVTDDATPGLNIGTVPTGTTPRLYVDGVLTAATYNPTTGTLTPNNPLDAGKYDLSYTLVDQASNESPPSGALTLTIDPSLLPATPSTPTTYNDDVGSIRSTTSTAPTTDDRQPGVNIGALPSGIQSAKLYVDGVETAATYNPATGTLTPNSPLAEGARVLTVSYVSNTGNEGNQSGPLNLTIDATAPATPLAPTQYVDNVGSVVSDTSTAPSTDDTTPGIKIPAGLSNTPSLYVDGVKVPSTYDAATGTLTPVNPVAEGAHAFTYTLTDPAGNESQPSPALNITVDTTPPAKPTAPTSYNDNEGAVQSPSSTAAQTDDTKPGLNIGTVPSGTTPNLYVNGVKVPATYDPATGTLTPVNALPEGAAQLSYSLSDPAGNESLRSDPLAITVDTTPPAKPDRKSVV